MTTPENVRPEDDAGNEQDQHDHAHDEASCPSCGSGMKRAQFRTGSVGHPTRDTKVCTSCGTRR